jgi:hypothetical protein
VSLIDVALTFEVLCSPPFISLLSGTIVATAIVDGVEVVIGGEAVGEANSEVGAAVTIDEVIILLTKAVQNTHEITIKTTP